MEAVWQLLRREMAESISMLISLFPARILTKVNTLLITGRRGRGYPGFTSFCRRGSCHGADARLWTDSRYFIQAAGS